MSNDNNIGTISFENKKRMEARRAKVDETLRLCRIGKNTNSTIKRTLNGMWKKAKAAMVQDSFNHSMRGMSALAAVFRRKN